MSADFYVRYLEGYTLEKENSLTIYGSNLKDYQLVSPKTGGYFEIEKMLLMFENFANGLFVGSPNVGQLLGGKKMYGYNITRLFSISIRFGCNGYFWRNWNKDYNLSNHFLCSIVTNWY
jgi:hypothetical protein